MSPIEPANNASAPSAAPSQRNRSVVYDSAVDVWLALLLITPILGAAGVGIALLIDGRADDAVTMFLTALAILGVTAALSVPCRVTLLSDSLTIRCGLLFWRVPYDRIRGVQRSSTWASGPALSLQRVIIQTDHKSHIISPKNREQFIADLRSRIVPKTAS